MKLPCFIPPDILSYILISSLTLTNIGLALFKGKIEVSDDKIFSILSELRLFANFLGQTKLEILFPRQSHKRFTFHVKLSDSILFLLGLSPILKVI